MQASPLAAESTLFIIPVPEQLIIGNRAKWKLDALSSSLGHPHVVVDFTNARYLDSSGLGVLVSVQKTLQERGTRLYVVGLNDDLALLFDLTKIDSLFTICETIADAERAAAS